MVGFVILERQLLAPFVRLHLDEAVFAALGRRADLLILERLLYYVIEEALLGLAIFHLLITR